MKKCDVAVVGGGFAEFAAGQAISLALRDKKSVSDINANELRSELRRKGAFIS